MVFDVSNCPPCCPIYQLDHTFCILGDRNVGGCVLVLNGNGNSCHVVICVKDIYLLVVCVCVCLPLVVHLFYIQDQYSEPGYAVDSCAFVIKGRLTSSLKTFTHVLPL